MPNNWLPDPVPLIGLLALQLGYLLCVGPWRGRFAAYGSLEQPGGSVGWGRRVVFVAGVLALGLALASPLDLLADRYLLSAHMIQHILLTIIGPPLLLLGTPGWLLRPALRWPVVARLAYIVTRGKLAFAIGNVTFLVWHIPALYDAALRNHAIHVVEHLTFLVAATIMWWPLVGTLPELPRLSSPLQMLYVFLQTLPGALLGIILGMASAPLYPSYTTAPRLWGIPVLADQHAAGLIMWVGTNFFWLGVLTAVFFAWAAREQAEEAAEAGVRGQGSEVRDSPTPAGRGPG